MKRRMGWGEEDLRADARAHARKAKNWAEADRLRSEIAAAGWEMEDRAEGYTLKRRASSPSSR